MLLQSEKLAQAMEKLPGWENDSTSIYKTFELKNFTSALDFVNRVGRLAEEADHHPDILIHGWNKVTITCSTHSKGGITDKDIALAGEIQAL